jgi:capsular polysaccharide biosynthesis protein
MTLAELDFTILDFAATPPEAQLRALLAAGFIAGASADLAAAAFCPPGTKIIEITLAEAFAPEAWMLSCRLGFTHAVLPCASDESGLQVNRDALSSLVFMLRFRR